MSKHTLNSKENIAKYKAMKKKKNNKETKKTDFIKRKKLEGDKSIVSRLQYRSSGLAKLSRQRLRYTGLSSPKNIGVWKTRKECRAKFKVNNNHNVEQTGKDFIILRGDMKLLSITPEKYPQIFYKE